MSGNPRWIKRPPGSNWGDFGPDDQLGRLNLLTPARVLEAVAEVREGMRFCLSLPLDRPGGNVLNPRRHPPALRPTLRGADANMNYQLGRDDPHLTDVVSDDLALIYLQYSTQWDSFAHVGQMFDVMGDGKPVAVYYNGYRAGLHVVGPASATEAGPGAVATSSAKALGIETMAAHAIQGRGVLIDLHAHLGRARQMIGYDALMRIIEADRVAVEPGDLVCLHTGFADYLLTLDGSPTAEQVETNCAVLDGRDARLLRWIDDSGLAALIADNYAVEGLPARPCNHDQCAFLPLHEHCLFKLGIPLGELWHLTPLANWLRARGRHRFLLTAPPLRLPGAVGSPVTPVATV